MLFQKRTNFKEGTTGSNTNRDFYRFIPKQLEKLVFDDVGLATKFLSSLMPCLSTMVIRSRKKFCGASLSNSQFFKLFGYIFKTTTLSFLSLATPQVHAKSPGETTINKTEAICAELSDTPTDTSDLRDQRINTIKSLLPAEIKHHALALKLSVALYMGSEAGHAILSVKESRKLNTQLKEDSTPVTMADHASNRMICETITSLYPGDGILSEESISGEKPLSIAIATGVNAEWTWVIDPLDGTKAFIKGTGQNTLTLDARYQGTHYGVHIGLLHKGSPVLGVNYYPELDTLYFALDGFAYEQIGNFPATSIVTKAVSGIHPILNPTPDERDRVGKIYEQLLGKEETSRFNLEGLFLDSFGYKMISIAKGDKCNLFVAPAGGPGFWDVCSMLPFVQAVGGQVTDWEGNPINFQDMSRSGLLPKGIIISMNPQIHKQVVDIIAKTHELY